MTGRQASLLALVPQDCSCAPALRQLAAQAGPAHVRLYLIGTPGAMPQLTELAAAAGQSSGNIGEDSADVLPTAYAGPALTAVLVQAGGSVSYVAHGLPQPTAMAQLEVALRQVSPVAANH